MRWAPAFSNRTATKVCAMVGKAVVRRNSMGPTRAEAPERMATRSLVQDVHTWKHACGKLRVCQARTVNIHLDSTHHRRHVRALAALCARGAVRFAAALCSQRAATHSIFRTHDMSHLSGLRNRAASAILLHLRGWLSRQCCCMCPQVASL